MIITKLIGGLGNQMFQYAAGRRAAHINRTTLKLDTSWFKNPEGAIKRDYLLNVFNIIEDFANDEEINKLKKVKPTLLTKIIKPYFKRTYVKQRYFHFDPNILKISGNVYLDGSWQSEKYFKDIESIIRQDFRFKRKPNIANKELIEQIKNTPSVSVHLRRGDYVSDKKTNTFHGVCNFNYYQKAVNYITRKVNKPHFFVFSDNPFWTEKNFKIRLPFYVIKHNYQKDHHYEDMRLMTYCQHHIIANSSFGWWGAWLNRKPSKVVIAPKKWFQTGLLNTKDVLPLSWIRI